MSSVNRVLSVSIGLWLALSAAAETPAIEDIEPGSAWEQIRASEGVVLVDLYADW